MAKRSLDVLASLYVFFDQSSSCNRWKKRSKIRKEMVKRFGQLKTNKAIEIARATYELLTPPAPPKPNTGTQLTTTKMIAAVDRIRGRSPTMVIMDELECRVFPSSNFLLGDRTC